jgi:hypothetical protein
VVSSLAFNAQATQAHSGVPRLSAETISPLESADAPQTTAADLHALGPDASAALSSGSHAGAAAPLANPGEALTVPPGSVDIALSPSTRQFLEPIVGIDPASVHIHQAPHGASATQGADAVSVGNDVLLAAGQAGESPRALGLLAHELTHVAHERQAPGSPAAATADNSPAGAQIAASTVANQASTTGTSISVGGPSSTPADLAPTPADDHTAALPESGATALSQFDSGSHVVPSEASQGREPQGATRPAESAAPHTAGVDDEPAARRVEASVVAAAQAAAGPFSDAAPGSAFRPFAPPTSDLAAAHFAASAHAAATAPAGLDSTLSLSTPDTDRPSALEPSETHQQPAPPPWDLEPTSATNQPDPWGGLPAPWEPLPAWLTSPTAFVTTSDFAGLNGNGSSGGSGTSGTPGFGTGGGATGVGSGSSGGGTGGGGSGSGGSGDSSGGGPGGAGGGNGTGGGGGGAHFAETGRPVDLPAAPPAPPANAAGAPPPVEPDLDALAQQVYTILKRRLASERRRLT